MHTFRVSAQESGEKLIAVISTKYGDSTSKKAIKRAIDTKQCRVNGRIVTVSTTPVFRGDRIEINLEGPSAQPSIDVLYQDEWILVVNKPSGLVCEKRVINQKFPMYRGELELVHRLDKETSGALILAKTQEAKKAFEALFKARNVQKVYNALADGEVKQSKGTIRSRLTQVGTHHGQPLWGSTKGEGGREAVTHWKRLEQKKGFAFLEIELETGRTHQIRVHLSEMGHPILGDTLYGTRFTSKVKASRNMLHASRLSFDHPFLNQSIEIIAPLPSDIIHLI